LAFITANGVNLPTPTAFDVGVQDISNAQRNAQGTMIIERIATKRTLTLTYAYITASDLATVLNAVSGTSFSVTYVDPVQNGNLTKTFYPGDRKMGMIDFQNGTARYQNVSFELIEL
jgi:hypothetical protein